MDLSIIIVSWNTRELLKKCLTSIYSETKDISFEVFVVDNNSSDETVGMVKKEFSQVKLIANKNNLGFAKANNQAIKESRGEFVILLNPDTELISNSLAQMLEFMRQDQRVGVLGPKLLNPNKTWQPSTRRFPNFLNQFVILLKLPHIFPNLKVYKNYLMKDFDGQSEREVDQVMGAAFMIRREVIEKVGMLDERYFIWFEEVDYCKMAKDAGWKVYYIPFVEVVHYGGESFVQLKTLKKQLMYLNSMIKYFWKHVW
ncbi:MAG: glycosyltransferase family 2 protein [Parcubacteria group bacterium]|nr:glycosyltransferase family 2 protein [Parcubacteria group bacterium]